jgi:hypothetical protein
MSGNVGREVGQVERAGGADNNEPNFTNSEHRVIVSKIWFIIYRVSVAQIYIRQQL